MQSATRSEKFLTNKLNERGQVLIEFSLTLLLLVLPAIIGGAVWFWISYDRISCANRAFMDARRELIITRRDSNISRVCGGVMETVSLRSLESLDPHSGALDFADLIAEASELWEDHSASLQQ